MPMKQQKPTFKNGLPGMAAKIESYITTWEQRCYPDGLPDEVPQEIHHLAPSYKKIALAILRNDYPLVSLGFSPPKSEVYNSIKREEIAQRNAK